MPDEVELHWGVDDLAREWDHLIDRSGGSTFMRPGWFAAWYDAFGRGRPEIVALRRDGRLVGLCPLERRGATLAAPVNWHTPVWHPVAEDASALETLARAVAGRARPHLAIAFADRGTPGLDALAAAAARPGWRSRTYELERSPYIDLGADTWEEREARLTPKRRSNLRRLARRLQERGELRLDVHDGTTDLDRLLAEGFEVEAAGWKGESATAIRSEPATLRFYTQLARWAGGRGSLALAFLRLDGEPLAFDFAIEEGGVHSLLKTAYSERHRDSAPGVLLRQRMLARSYELGHRSYEFLGDPLDWKLEWTDTVRERMALDAFVPGPGGRAAWLTWAYARPAFNRLRSARA
jgi:CelD/BcsL family acetyltransferase involved in cellulose biosynthesis